MYKVFRDPEGTRFLEQRAGTVCATNQIAVLPYTNELEIYKKRIQSLNVEVIRLNNEVEMVLTCNAYTCNISNIFAHNNVWLHSFKIIDRNKIWL